MKSFGTWVYELRSGKDISLREAARRSDVSAAFWSGVENDEKIPSKEVGTRMAGVLGVDESDFVVRSIRAKAKMRNRSENEELKLQVARSIFDHEMSDEDLEAIMQQIGRKG